MIMKQFLILLIIILNICTIVKGNINQSEFDDHPCEIKLQQLYSYYLNSTSNTSIPEDRLKEIKYSGKNLNDLGDFNGCRFETTKNISNYFILSQKGEFRGSIQLGLCLPIECDKEYLNSSKDDLINLINKMYNLTINSNIIAIDTPRHLIEEQRTKNFFPMMLVLMITMLVLFFSFYSSIPSSKIQVKQEGNSSENLLKSSGTKNNSKINYKEIIFDAFNIKQNLSKIFFIQSTNELCIFDGVRAIANYTVIIAHTFMFISNCPVKNLIEMKDIFQNFYTTMLANSFYSVDVFFYLSGFLNYISLNQDKKGNIFIAIIYRVLRLYPLYIFSIFATTYLPIFFVSGPSINGIVSYSEQCKNLWWHNLLFINNLFFYSSSGDVCMGHAWYLANDFQFFLVFAIIWYYVMKKNNLLGNVILIIIFVSSIIIQIILIIGSDIFLGDIKRITNDQTIEGDFFYVYYIKPWNRITTYILGIFFANLYLNKKKLEDSLETIDGSQYVKNDYMTLINLKIKISKYFSSIIFLVSACLMILICLLMHPYISDPNSWSLLKNSLFVTFGKLIFTFCVGLILHLILCNKLKFLKNLLSFRIFGIVSKISYAIYLIHPYVILTIFANYPSSLYFLNLDVTIWSLSFYIQTAFFAIFFTVLFDSPVIGLLKIFTRKK